MIEFPNIPTVRRMTPGALRAESASVDVFTRVAAVAVFGRSFICAARMTLNARHGDMQSDQWEIY